MLTRGCSKADGNMLDATQAFATAAEDGGLTGSGALPVELGMADASLAAAGPDFDVLGASFGAEIFSAFGIPDIFLP